VTGDGLALCLNDVEDAVLRVLHETDLVIDGQEYYLTRRAGKILVEEIWVEPGASGRSQQFTLVAVPDVEPSEVCVGS
jgi:hypothetical protein